MKLVLFSWICAVLFLSACQKESFTIQQNCVNMYVELLIAHENYGHDLTMFQHAKNGALSNYDISYKDMQSHINKIEKRPELWEEFQQAVVARIKEIKTNYKGD